MPLYMDRHELPGITAAEVARAHVTDLAIEADYGVHFLAYWFDAEHAEAFCLATAPGPSAMQDVHRAGHGLVPNEIISVSEDEVLRFLAAPPIPPTTVRSTAPSGRSCSPTSRGRRRCCKRLASVPSWSCSPSTTPSSAGRS